MSTQAVAKGLHYDRIRLIDIFGLADKDKVNYGLGHALTLKRNGRKELIHKDNVVAVAKVVNKKISFFVESFTPKLDNEQLLACPMLTKIPTYICSEK